MKSRFAAGRAKALTSLTATEVAPPLARSAGSARFDVASSPEGSQADSASAIASAARPPRLRERLAMRSQLLARVLPEVARRQAERLDRLLQGSGLGDERGDQGVDGGIVGPARLDLDVDGHAPLGAVHDDLGRIHDDVDPSTELVGDRGLSPGAQQRVDARPLDRRAVHAPVAAAKAVPDAERVQVDVAMGVVREAGMLVLLRILGERDLDALASELAVTEPPHRLEDLRDRHVAHGDVLAVVVAAVRIPARDHAFEILHEQL